MFILACYPGTTGSIQQVLRTQDIGLEEQLRILYATVHMAFCRKIHHIVKLELCEQFIHQSTVADVSLYEETTFVIDIFCNRSQIASVCQSVQHHKFHVIVLLQHIFHEIRAYKASSSCNKISLHI